MLEPKPLKLSVPMRPVNCPSLGAYNRLLNIHFTAASYFLLSPSLGACVCGVCVCVEAVAYTSECRVSSSCHAVIGLGASSAAVHRRTVAVGGPERTPGFSFTSRVVCRRTNPTHGCVFCV